MASFIQLLKNKVNDIIYPQTLVKAVFDDDGNRLDTIVLTKTNTVSYTPSEDYHPATKAYVDGKTLPDTLVLDGGSASTEIS